MIAVADDFAVHGAQTERSTHQTVGAVVEGRHAVVDMGQASGAVGISHAGLLVGGGAVADTDHDAPVCQVTGQGKVLISFGGHGHIADIALGGSLKTLKLLDGGFGDVLFRLRALILHVQIRAFKVDAQNLRALIAFFHDLCHIGNSLGQNFLALGDGGGKKRGDTLGDNIL